MQISSYLPRWLKRKAPYAMALVATAVLLACGGDGVSTPAATVTVPPRTISGTKITLQDCKYTLEDLRKKSVRPEEYLDDKFNCLPEAVEARNGRVLAGFLYNPSTQALDEALDSYFRNITPNQAQIESLVNGAEELYRSENHREEGAIVPHTVLALGQLEPVYIAFHDSLFDSPNEEGDMNSMIGVHYIDSHATDWANGLKMAGVRVDYAHNLSPETTSLAFLNRVMELRALHNELLKAHERANTTGVWTLSSGYSRRIAEEYAREYGLLANAHDLSTTEEKIRSALMAEIGDVVPDMQEDGTSITYKVNGVPETRTFTHSN